MMQNKSIKTPLSYGFFMLFIILLTALVFIIFRMNSVADLMNKLYQHPLAVSNAVLRIDGNIIRIHRSMKDVALSTNQSEIETASALVDEYERQIYKDFTIIAERFLGDKKMYERALEKFSDWKEIREQVILLMNHGKVTEAAAITKGKGAQHVKKLEKAMMNLREFAYNKASNFQESGNAIKSKSTKTAYAIAAILFVGGAVFIIFLSLFERKVALVHKTVEKSEMKFRLFFENDPDYCYMVSPQGLILDINAAALAVLGYKKEELIGIPLIPTIYAPSSLKRAAYLMEKWQQGGKIKNEELSILTEYGEERTILLSVEALKDQNNNPIHTISVQRDITELKKLQDKEKRAVAAVSAAKTAVDTIEAMTDGVILVDMNGVIRSVNPAFMKMTSFKKTELIKKNIQRILPLLLKGKDKEKIKTSFEQIMKGILPSFLPTLIKSRHNNEFPVVISVAFIKNIDKQPQSFVITIKDISKLKRTEKDLNNIFALSTDLICIAGFDGYFKRINPAFHTALGYTEEELLEKPFLEFIHPQDKEATLQELQSLEAGETTINFNNRYRCKNGTYCCLEWRATPVITEELIYAVARDITELEKSRDALRKSEKRLSEAQRIAQFGNWDWDISNNELFWSEEIYRIFGLEPKTFGATFEAFLSSVHPDDREFVKRAVNEAIYQNKLYSIDHKILLPNGAQRMVHEQAKVYHDKDGQPIRMVGVVQDITARLQAEEALRKRQNALESVYAIATASSTNLESTFEQIALSLAKILNTPSAIIARFEKGGLLDITRLIDGKFHKGEHTCINCVLCKLICKEKKVYQYNGSLKEEFSERNCFHTNDFKSLVGIPILDKNEVTIGLLCAVDRRERKFDSYDLYLVEIFAGYLAHEISRTIMENRLVQDHEMKLLGSLTSGVAHEVRNPLNAIMANSEALFKRIGNTTVYMPYIKRIKDQVRRLSNLMTDLLMFGKPLETRDFSRISVKNLLHEIISSWQPETPCPQDIIELDTESLSENLKINVDHIKIIQLFFNLMDNALHYMKEKGKIIISAQDTKDNFIRIKIIDNGTGIPPHNMPHIFEPFYTTRQSGTGLGLCIVRKIVENHQGVIKLYNNTPPPGLTAEVSLPLLEPRIVKAVIKQKEYQDQVV